MTTELDYKLWFYPRGGERENDRETHGSFGTLAEAMAASDLPSSPSSDCWDPFTTDTWQLDAPVIEAAGRQHSWWSIDRKPDQSLSDSLLKEPSAMTGPEAREVTITERLERMRAGQLAALPTVAEIRMAYPLAGGGATLRLMTAEGSTAERHMIPLTERGPAGRENDPAGIYLDAITDGANTEGLKIAAGWHLMRLGFNYARGAAWAPYTGSASSEAQWKEWAPMLHEGHRWPHTVRVAITALAEHLAYIDRAYGPAPELPDLPDDVSAHPSGPRSWQISYANRRFWQLSYRPQMGGDVWTLYADPARTKSLARAANPGELLATIPARDAEAQARATARKGY
ncbi:hypothetical protein [Streptomyces sp. NPDC003032]